MSQNLTVNLPTELYVRIKERAEQANHSMEEEAIAIIAANLATVSTKETVAERFQRLANSRQNAVGHLSSSSKRESHPAYQEIIAMGPAVVPFLLGDLETNRRHWFTALTVITGTNPIAEKDAGNVPRMIETWLQWAKKKG